MVRIRCHSLLLIALILAVPAFADEKADVRNAVEDYYFASIMKDMDIYLSTQMTEHLTPEELQLKKDTITSIWSNFDSAFAADIFTDITVDGEVAIAQYQLSATITDLTSGEEFSYALPFTALLFLTENGWRVFAAMPSAQFNLISFFEMLDEQEETAEIYASMQHAEEENSDEGDSLKEYDAYEMEESGQAVKDCNPDLSLIKDIDIEIPDIFGLRTMLPDGTAVKVAIGEQISYLKAENGRIISAYGDIEARYIVSMEPCTYERVIATGQYQKELTEGNIIIKASGFDIKLLAGSIAMKIYNFFKPSPAAIWVEAESGTLSGIGRHSFIGATSRGPGELYLGDKDAKAEYDVHSPKSSEFHIYLRVSDDGLHMDGARSVVFDINGIQLPYAHRSTDYITDTGHWGWEYLGKVELQKGSNKVIITKPKQTSAAFTLDRFVFSEAELELK